MKTKLKIAKTELHNLDSFEECSLFNSEHEWNRGFDRAVCSCGWKSAPAGGSHKVEGLAKLFELHLKTINK